MSSERDRTDVAYDPLDWVGSVRTGRTSGVITVRLIPFPRRREKVDTSQMEDP